MADTHLPNPMRSVTGNPPPSTKTHSQLSEHDSALSVSSPSVLKTFSSVSREKNDPSVDGAITGQQHEETTADAEAGASSSLSSETKGSPRRSRMRHVPMLDDDEWVEVPLSLKELWQQDYRDCFESRSRNHAVYKQDSLHREENRAADRPTFELDHTLTDSDSESDGSGRLNPRFPDDDDFDDDRLSYAGLAPWQEWLNINEHRDRPQGPPEEPLYPQGLPVDTECYVCFEEAKLRRRLCCDFPVCDPCLESYLTVQISQANVNVECLNIDCNSYIHRNEISARLPANMKMKFYKFLIDANVDPTIKTCPRCSVGHQVDKADLRNRKILKQGLLATCARCELEWCFNCHSPWHKGLTCKQFRKGDALLKDWAKEFHYGQINAQKCPKCKVFIQRTLGCDHMTCSRCDSSFCYRCGENYRGFKLLGNHFSRLSPFGCRYNFMPDSPHTRRLIRGAVLGGKLIGGLALSGFVVAAGAFLLGISVVALPAWGGYKLHKRRKYRQYMGAMRKWTNKRQDPRVPNAADITIPPAAVIRPSLDYDDSSDGNRNRVIVGLQLPDSQRVEVLVHRTVCSHGDTEDGSAAVERRDVVTDSSVILTNIQEVLNEDGYTTVVANIHAKAYDTNAAQGCAFVLDSSDSSDDSEEEREREDKGVSFAGESAARTGSSYPLPKRNQAAVSKENHSKRNRANDAAENLASDKDRLLLSGNTHDQGMDTHANSMPMSKPPKEKREKETEGVKDKSGNHKDVVLNGDQKETQAERSERNEKKQKDAMLPAEKKEKPAESGEKTEKKLRDKDKEAPSNRRPAEQREADVLNKENTNGCFGNIFSKKLTVIQIHGRRNTVLESEAQKPGSVYYKSGTWEKSNEKGSNPKHTTTVDIRNTSHFNEKLPGEKQSYQTSHTAVGNGYDKGLLLQDCVVLSPPGDFKSQNWEEADSLSLSSSLSEEEGGGEREEVGDVEEESGCCLSASDSFRGSTLSCDIVTYL
ncbi:hypothetical protein V1264_008996 [Littorina saxatilis]|uniref:RBR-type E3 ubiquitin transferase n=1 Tax=Littorina saxatilis TaxID=31220 RepID=A0AAN9G1E7_9CAEN